MQLIAKATAFAFIMSLLAAPAYADKKNNYFFYGNHPHGHGKPHHKPHHKKWQHGHYNKWHHPHYNKTIVVHKPYVQHSYYNQPSYSAVHCTNRVNPLGLLLGGAAGGVVGHQFGKGSGKTAATIGGAVLGSAIGAGATYQTCTEQVFHQVPLGMPVYWQTADAGEAYSVTATRDYRTAGRYCREYQAISTVAGRQQQTYGTACMQPDGSWQIVN